MTQHPILMLLRRGLLVMACQGSLTGFAAPDASQPAATTRTLYVSPSGNDKAFGSAQAPWRTLQKAADATRPGDTVLVSAGSYAGFIMGWDAKKSGLPSAPISFKAAAGTIINARNAKTPDGINLEGASYIVIDGFSIKNETKTLDRAGIRSVRNSGVVIRNNRCEGMGTWGIFTSFSENVLIEKNITANSVKEHGIYVSNSADNPVVRQNTVFGNADSGIQLNGDVSQGGNGIISGALIEANMIHANGTRGGAGINLDGVQNSVVRNNLLYDNHSSGIALFQDCGGGPSKNNLVVNNTVIQAENGRWAIKITGKATGNVVYNNILHHLGRSRGAVAISPDCVAGLISDFNIVDGRFTRDGGDSILSLSQWREAVAQDVHSLAATPERLFVNPAADDYHLCAGSPALNAGTTLPPPRQAPATDLEGRQRTHGAKEDIGAYESADPPPRAVAGAVIPTALFSGESSTGIALLLVLLAAACGYACLRRRGLHCWLGSYLLTTRRRRSLPAGEPVHVLLCIADHFEPHNGHASDEQADARVRRWTETYPAAFGNFHDSDGRTPRHTFFYPIEQYNPRHVDALASLCRTGHGEVEIHLHHDNDTSENLRQCLLHARDLLASRHDLLSRHRATGELAYGFVHGNWALDNSRPDGRRCGVNNELDVLRETGCYADFTLPSAPDLTQTRKINSIYYACDDPRRPKSHDSGINVGTGPAPNHALMLIQGPLLLDWGRRKWGLAPRIENGCVQENQCASLHRLDLWLRARVQVPRRPDWFFVKLHAHGANEAGQRALFGESMLHFHKQLARRSREQPLFQFHYVTAREMYNLVRAAEAGWTGSVDEARNFDLA